MNSVLRFFCNEAHAATVGVNNSSQTVGDVIFKILENLAYPLGGLALGFIGYAAFLYMTCAGNPDKVAKAHKALLYAILGVLLIAVAIALTNGLAEQISCWLTGTSACTEI